MLGGGASTIFDMISRLRFNRGQLRGKSKFRKKNVYLGINVNELKRPNRKLHYRHASKEELDLIRSNTVHDRKIESRVLYIIILAFIPILIFGIYKFYKLTQQDRLLQTQQIQKKIQFESTEKLNVYLYYIHDGDKWLKQNHWRNAIFQYKEALKLFPDDFDAKMRLATAYVYSCSDIPGNWAQASLLINNLSSTFPENEDIQCLKQVLIDSEP